MELSREDVAQCFALHLGAEVMVSEDWDAGSGGFHHNKGEVLRLHVGLLDAMFLEASQNPIKAQLILSPLEDISEEDAIAVSSIYMKNVRGGFEKADNREKIRAGQEVAFNLNGGVVGHYWALGKMVAVIDFLRSRSYMLPYKGVNLFDANLAIRKNQK